MTQKRFIRRRGGNPWNSETSAAANRARWAADRARRDEDEPARRRELAEIRAENLPADPGDILGTLQWTCARSGKVRRWTVRIGTRRDQVTVETANGRQSRSMGWTRLLNSLRGYLAGTKR